MKNLKKSSDFVKESEMIAFQNAFKIAQTANSFETERIEELTEISFCEKVLNSCNYRLKRFIKGIVENYSTMNARSVKFSESQILELREQIDLFLRVYFALTGKDFEFID